MESISLKLTVNDEALSFDVPANTTLLELLRDRIGLTGAKEGCGEGVCGACTVLLDGHPVRACLTLAAEAEGARVDTVEGLATGHDLDPLQQAFIDHGAVQCGFCTAGMLMSAKGLLARSRHPNEGEIRRAISGNICRCTGYAKIVEAVAAAAEIPSASDPD